MSSDPNAPQKNDESNSDTNSVMPAIYDFDPRTGYLDTKTVKAACTKEKKITHQREFMIHLVDNTGMASPLEMMKLARRVVLCTSCGNLRLIT